MTPTRHLACPPLPSVKGKRHGAAAWPQVSERLCQPFDAEVLGVLFDTQLKSAVVADGDAHRAERRLV